MSGTGEAPKCEECGTLNYNTATQCAACGAALTGNDHPDGTGPAGPVDPHLARLDRIHAELATIKVAVVFLAVVTAIGILLGIWIGLTAAGS